MVCHVCVVGASMYKYGKSLRLFHVHSVSLPLKEFSCVLMHGCVCLRFPPMFSLICTRRKIEGTNPQCAALLILGET